MGFAVYHCEKKKTTGGGLGNHIDREKGKEHTYPHADPNRLKDNIHFKINEYSKLPFAEAINKRLEDGYKGKRAIRKDAVKYVTHVLTGSHEDMKRIFSSPESKEAWVKKNFKFLEDEYGKENIVRFNLHLDEKTPHLHAVTVPITNEGKLSAKEIIGNRKEMQNRQDRYAEAMESFGLKRGLRNTGIKHESISEYRKRVNKPIEAEIKVIKGVFGGIHKKTLKKAEESLKTSKTHILELKAKLENANYRASTSSDTATHFKNRAKKLQKDVDKLGKEKQQIKKDAHKMLMSNENVNEYRQLFFEQQKQEREAEIKRKKGRGFSRS
ncbi:MobV family relaxase [Tenacibaculum soleae]|uniref:MobV family relaxase n=1 Tax=Tenacibaculum soleae TaxID=447689 RepID=UPI002301ADC0|nr:MobV family relaxase [Tenacibaculum soleae]